MRTFKNLILLLAFGLMVLSCRKNTEQPQQQIIAKTWRTGAVLINNAAGIADYSSFRWTFRPDGTYLFTMSSGNTESGKWKLTGDNKTLILDAGAANERQAIIKRLTSSNFDWQLSSKDFKQGVITIDYQLIPSN